MEPRTITWLKGEPTAKLNAVPEGALCTVVREWIDREGRPQRNTREGYISEGCFTGRFFGDDYLSDVNGFDDSVVSVTVTLPTPKWAEDKWLMFAYLNEDRVYTEQLSEISRAVLAKQEARGDVVVIRLTKEQQDALDGPKEAL